MIPYGRQHITPADVEAVTEVLKSDFLTQGPVTPRFEQAVADYCGAGFAVSMNSATSALHAACLALGLGPGDYLWTSPVTFVASANCALYCGAQVDFVDIDPATYNLSVEQLEIKLARAEKSGRLPKIVMSVHLSGQPCNMRGMQSLANKYGFKVIEDASHAIGAKYGSEPVGNCRYSDITVFSFHPVKIITTAEGGMALTNNAQLAERMRLVRSHGITRDQDKMTHASDGPWYYQQVALGYNYRMTDLQAALGLSQMQRIDDYVRRRHELARQYDTLLDDFPVIRPWQSPDGYSSFHLYIVRLKPRELKVTHRKVFESMRTQGIGVNLHYIPVHLQPYYEAMGFRPGEFPEAERYYAEAMSLPLFPLLQTGDIESIVNSLRQAIA